MNAPLPAHAVDLEPAPSDGGVSWREVLRVPALSAGVYLLRAGAADPQRPHAEDELYWVLAGSATLEVGGRRLPAAAGDVLFVPAGAPHRFVDVTADLRAFVVFAPAETDVTG